MRVHTDAEADMVWPTFWPMVQRDLLICCVAFFRCRVSVVRELSQLLNIQLQTQFGLNLKPSYLRLTSLSPQDFSTWYCSSRVDVDGFNDPSAGSPHLFRLRRPRSRRAELAPCSIINNPSELSGPQPSSQRLLQWGRLYLKPTAVVPLGPTAISL
jgi:hypothetical protein